MFFFKPLLKSNILFCLQIIRIIKSNGDFYLILNLNPNAKNHFSKIWPKLWVGQEIQFITYVMNEHNGKMVILCLSDAKNLGYLENKQGSY